MKKGFYVALAAVLAFSMAGCSSKKDTSGSTPDKKAEAVGEVDGSLKSFTNGTLVITDEKKEELSFKITSKAKFTCKNMLAGDNVTVIYDGKIQGTNTANAVVTEVEDKGGKTTEAKQQEIVGTLKAYSNNSLTLKTNDGKEYVFSIVGAKQVYKNGIEPGNWIHVIYTGTINGTDTSGVKVVEITDDSDNVKQEQAKVAIKDVNEAVWATASVNVRDNYTTNANVLGTLAANDEVTRTGTCDNGWSRITYNGNTAYVYGDYLTTTAPPAPTQPAPVAANPQPSQPAQPAQPAPTGDAGNTADAGDAGNTGDTGDAGDTADAGDSGDNMRVDGGYVVSLTADGVLTLDINNADYAFNITNAQQNYTNGILVGNEVTITYTGDISDSLNAVVYTVTDADSNTDNQSRITGTVQGASMNSFELATDDNAILAISTDGATINVDGLTEGSRVTVTLDLSQTVSESNLFYAAQVDPE